MKPDHDQAGKPSRRSHAAPVPGMPYRPHSDFEQSDSADDRRAFEFIESRPMAGQQDAPGGAYNPWEEQGWVGGEAPFPLDQEPEAPAEEQYLKPMLDLERELPDAYEGYGEYAPEKAYAPDEAYAPEEMYAQNEAYAGPEADEPAYTDVQEPPPPPLPPEPKPERRSDPWRAAVILCCIAGLLFCAVEIYRIAHSVIESETELREYRELYLKEHNEDFMNNAQAVALRPPGETYPPTASPVPVQTPTPTPRIAVNDPLIGVLDGGIDPEQSVAPVTPTPARTLQDRYADNPLLVVRDEMTALQEENEDVIGQLVIDGLLSELVVLRNNTYYLNHNAMGTYSGYGTVFADENLTLRNPPENILLYGRTSTEGKCFAPLKSYISEGIDFAGRYAFMSFKSPYEDARYVIAAIVTASSDPGAADYFDYRKLTFDTDVEMLSFAEEAIGRSKYIFGVGIKATDRLLTLVTLSDGMDQSSIVIVCRMLRDGERDGYIQTD